MAMSGLLIEVVVVTLAAFHPTPPFSSFVTIEISLYIFDY